MEKAPSVAEIKQWMPKFRDTAGLIVDVRDNDGGDREALRLLYSYLAAPDAPPRVFTAAAYRLHNAHKENHLGGDHRMYLAGAKEWTPKERQAVAEFAKTFTPGWELPKGQFSNWHYMALSRLNDPDVYHYDKPVIVLLNGKSFSATDIFLSGLKGMKDILLLGTPSSGGSAASEEIDLGGTPLRVRIGSMVSFQADGTLFDGHGVRPDVLVEPVPEYYIGGRDNGIEEALRRIRAQ
jgi:C-terminal processing protease CtpA/Prc